MPATTLGTATTWGLVELLHPDIRIETSACSRTSRASTADTRARGFWRQMCEPWGAFHIDVEHVEDEGDCALASIRFGGRGADSGVEVDMRFGMLARARDGLASELVNRRTFDEARTALRSGPTSRPARSSRAP